MKRELRQTTPAASRGFTLVELLVVITIIMLLVGIIVPTISAVLKSASVTQSKVRINELADAIKQYAMDTQNNPAGLYPGQPADDLEGNGNDKYENNGSRLLLDALKDNSNDDPNDDIEEDVEYATFKDEDVLNKDSDKEAISDRFGSGPMAILYYPSRLSESALVQYVEDDNSKIADSTTPKTKWDSPENQDDDNFGRYIKDRRFDGDDSTTPYNPGKFLLIGAGKDREYGTSDDLTNWK